MNCSDIRSYEEYRVSKSKSKNKSTKDLESGTVFLHLLQTCQAFLSLRTKCQSFY